MIEHQLNSESLTVLVVELDHKHTSAGLPATLLDRKLEAVPTLWAELRDKIGCSAMYGTTSFALLMTNCDLDAGLAAAQRIQQAARDAKNSTTLWELPFTLSLGLADAHTGDDWISIIKRAEASLHAATAQGGNSIFVQRDAKSRPIRFEDAIDHATALAQS